MQSLSNLLSTLCLLLLSFLPWSTKTFLVDGEEQWQSQASCIDYIRSIL